MLSHRTVARRHSRPSLPAQFGKNSRWEHQPTSPQATLTGGRRRQHNQGPANLVTWNLMICSQTT